MLIDVQNILTILNLEITYTTIHYSIYSIDIEVIIYVKSFQWLNPMGMQQRVYPYVLHQIDTNNLNTCDRYYLLI